MSKWGFPWASSQGMKELVPAPMLPATRYITVTWENAALRDFNPAMSQMGQSRRIGIAPALAECPLSPFKADIASLSRRVRQVPNLNELSWRVFRPLGRKDVKIEYRFIA